MTDNNYAHDAKEARARGVAMRGERLRRAGLIRRRIVGGAVALFVAAWLVIAVVLVSGHDPALAKRAAASASASSSAPATTTSATSSGSDSSSTPSTTSSQSSGNSGSVSLSSVTTSQS